MAPPAGGGAPAPSTTSGFQAAFAHAIAISELFPECLPERVEAIARHAWLAAAVGSAAVRSDGLLIPRPSPSP